MLDQEGKDVEFRQWEEEGKVLEMKEFEAFDSQERMVGLSRQ